MELLCSKAKPPSAPWKTRWSTPCRAAPGRAASHAAGAVRFVGGRDVLGIRGFTMDLHGVFDVCFFKSLNMFYVCLAIFLQYICISVNTSRILERKNGDWTANDGCEWNYLEL